MRTTAQERVLLCTTIGKTTTTALLVAGHRTMVTRPSHHFFVSIRTHRYVVSGNLEGTNTIVHLREYLARSTSLTRQDGTDIDSNARHEKSQREMDAWPPPHFNHHFSSGFNRPPSPLSHVTRFQVARSSPTTSIILIIVLLAHVCLGFQVTAPYPALTNPAARTAA